MLRRPQESDEVSHLCLAVRRLPAAGWLAAPSLGVTHVFFNAAKFCADARRPFVKPMEIFDLKLAEGKGLGGVRSEAEREPVFFVFFPVFSFI